jgi:serine/threonine-protein kinase
VHRDIKPANVFLTHRLGCAPLVKVLDFGISKMITASAGEGREETRLTHPGMVIGTIGYMSMEQARGTPDLDARVDLYACGVIFYEMLTGRRPFPATNIAELVPQLLKTNPTPASELVPALPSGVDAVIDRAMARNRDDRYTTAHEMQRDLQALRERSSAAFAAAIAAVPQPTRRATESPPVWRSPLVTDGSQLTTPEPAPSSLDIPIDFATETPPSGETLPGVDLPELGDDLDDQDTLVTPVDQSALTARLPKVPRK